MNQVPDVCDTSRYWWILCPNFAAMRQILATRHGFLMEKLPFGSRGWSVIGEFSCI
jgi:hypothetical protein